LFLIAALCAFSFTTKAIAASDDYTTITRGRALTTAGDCIACHTAPGQPSFAGGRDLETPFGLIRSANLTPDGETGLGRWSADDFYRAMHDGRGINGLRLYPAFPYPYFTKVTREDSDAIFAYLQKLPPVKNAVNRNALPFPYNIRSTMIAWNMLYFTPGTFTPDTKRSAEYNRGAYLVEALGHCGACHTPMTSLGGSDFSRPLQSNRLLNWIAPNITNDMRTGVGAWSIEDIVTYLQTGRNAHAAATGPMAEVVSNSTSQMDTASLHAIAVYLKGQDMPYAPAVTPLAATDPQMQAGAMIYEDTCKACHMKTGEGVDYLFPRLAHSANVQQSDPATLIRVVLQGTKAAATAAAPTGPAMPSLGWRLSDAQVADVITYIRNSWGNAAAPVSAATVRDQRSRF
jgi:mono/diheme cytochrome c family protein